MDKRHFLIDSYCYFCNSHAVRFLKNSHAVRFLENTVLLSTQHFGDHEGTNRETVLKNYREIYRTEALW